MNYRFRRGLARQRKGAGERGGAGREQEEEAEKQKTIAARKVGDDEEPGETSREGVAKGGGTGHGTPTVGGDGEREE